MNFTCQLWYVRGVSKAVRQILSPLGMKVSFRPNKMLKHMSVIPKDHILEWDNRCHVPGTMFKLSCYLCGTNRQVPWPTTLWMRSSQVTVLTRHWQSTPRNASTPWTGATPRFWTTTKTSANNWSLSPSTLSPNPSHWIETMAQCPK